MVKERFHQLAMEAMVVKEEKVVYKDFFCILSVFVYFETMMQFWDTIDITSTYLGFWESSVEQVHRKQNNM